MSLLDRETVQWIRNEMKQHLDQTSIPNTVLSYMIDNQLFKLIIPKSLGGKALELPEAVQIFQEASYVDGSFGWLVTVGSGGGMFTRNFTKEAASTYYQPKDAVIAGSGFPAGIAERTDGGYIINGEWFYCSGSDYASIFTATCRIKNDSKLISFIFEKEQVKVLQDWDAFGLEKTSSHTIRITNQFVPEIRAFSIFETKNEYGLPIHQFPFLPFSEASFAAITLGIGKHFIEEVVSFTEQNKSNWQHGKPSRYEVMIEKIETETARWKNAEQAFHDAVKNIWQDYVSGKDLSEDEQRAFGTVCKRAVTTMLTCANNLFRFIGMKAIMKHSEINQIWRDLHTASQHTFLTPIVDEDNLAYRPD
ncbi:alkylation response protein AidB-like acyl-CoA dehydrogenase [Cerasibacillus quisquiliarum]|uniref:Hydroxylase n=1 Tax=Cerasibacillus quisquiliarum TaxID=227865 RepID=A0A511UYA8_9BACI|nr:acyl-CoA dehydrogenase family protein [Cerasibacillus quisquiliarum]MBB5146811.1 alkylation response protein AidB-like acyl-CoA dehydrogenase [Cerasibacillus quisquiliarum]GEN31610.1 hydroxylase [Cerasibacillus quisquiliarum]